MVMTGFAAATAYACGCRDIGCLSSLTVEVTGPDGARPTTFTGVLFVGTSSRAFACSDMSPPVGAWDCEPGRVSMNLPTWDADADTVGLELDGGDSGSYSGQLELESEDWSPDNGPFCGPTCARASGAVTLRP